MAEIPQENINRIVQNYQGLINIVNLAMSAEYKLFAQYGETEATINDLNALSNVATSATDSFKRLNAITIRIATIQPQTDVATANMLLETIIFNEARIPAWLRSIEEVVNNWSLQ